EGGLIEQDGELYCFDRVSPRTRKPKEEAFDGGDRYRGYRWFDRYEPAQLEALGRLVDDLCTRFAIPRQYPDPPFAYYGDALARFEGIIGHAMVRPDKSDPAPDPRLWQTLEQRAALKPAAVSPPARPKGPPALTSREIEALFAQNAARIHAMDIAAGSLVKWLLMELERRRTYLRLAEPKPGTHTIGYEVVQGDRGAVQRIAKALGFLEVTDRRLEVRHA
ncbi:MAG: N-acetylmuramoyl-L-alanine amidase, partial [Gemmatimonadetes bacterium]|nr:N-acetylmuramoyl-L-alanine amidase [Gemmatimonadota bacterium]